MNEQKEGKEKEQKGKELTEEEKDQKGKEEKEPKEQKEEEKQQEQKEKGQNEQKGKEQKDVEVKENKDKERKEAEKEQNDNLNVKISNPPKNRNTNEEIPNKNADAFMDDSASDENEDISEKDKNTQIGEDIVEIKKDNPKIAKEKNEKYNENNKEKKKNGISQIYELDNDEKNELSFDNALIYDDRTFCKYYYFLLQNGHIIFSIFCRQSDYNIFSVKLGLLFMLFPINLAMNIFFFDSNNIKANYIQKIEDISNNYSYFLNAFVSSILASIFHILLKLLCLTHNSIRSLRKIKDVETAKKKSIWILRCIKLRITIYYFLSFIFLIIFGYYIGCFCAIFENTQIELIKSMFTSWLLSLLYPFVIYFIASIFRRVALRYKIKCFYAINQIFQLI